MNSLYCDIFGKRVESTMLRVFLRILFLLILLTINHFFGVDIALIFGLAVLAADLDSIAEILEKKSKKDC